MEGIHHLLRARPDILEIQEQAVGAGLPVVIFEDEIVGHAEFLDGPFAHPLFGDVDWPDWIRSPGDALVISFSFSITWPF